MYERNKLYVRIIFKSSLPLPIKHMTLIGTPSKVPSNWLDTIKKEMMNKKAYYTIKSIACTRSFKILWAKFTVYQSKYISKPNLDMHYAQPKNFFSLDLGEVWRWNLFAFRQVFSPFDGGTKRSSKYRGNHKQVGESKALGERRMRS